MGSTYSFHYICDEIYKASTSPFRECSRKYILMKALTYSSVDAFGYTYFSSSNCRHAAMAGLLCPPCFLPRLFERPPKLSYLRLLSKKQKQPEINDWIRVYARISSEGCVHFGQSSLNLDCIFMAMIIIRQGTRSL